MKYDPISRRFFLQGLGASLLIPYLPSLLPRAFAASPISKRFVAYWNPNGQYKRLFWPAQDPTQMISPELFVQDLRAVSGDLSPILSSTLFGSLKSKMLLLRGLDGTTNFNHNGAVMLSGSFRDDVTLSGNASIDYVLGQSSKVYASTPAARSIQLRPFPDDSESGYHGISFIPNGKGGFSLNSDDHDAATAFNRIFGNFKAPTSSGGGAPAPAPAPAGPSDEKKVVDKVFADFSRLMTNRRMSADDRARVQSHMDRLSDLQTQLAPAAATSSSGSAAPASGNSCTVPTLTGGSWTHDAAYKNHIDLIVAALACGLTNVATLMARTNPFFDATYSHDTISHNGDETNGLRDNALRIATWHATKYQYLISQMDKIVEADGQTLLDHSLVYWGGEIAHGLTHRYDSMPVVLAGSLSGFFKTGYYVDYRQKPLQGKLGSSYPDLDCQGRPYNQLLVTILQGMGLQPADYETNGQAGFGDQTLFDFGGQQSPQQVYGKYMTTTNQRSPLPFIAG